MNAGHFLNPSEKPYAAMLGGMLLPIFLMITCTGSVFSEKRSKMMNASAITLCALCVVIGLIGFYNTNAVQLKLRLNQFRTESELTQMMSRISAEPDYSLDTPVAIVLGNLNTDVYNGFETVEELGMQSAIGYTVSLYAHLHQMVPGVTLVYPDAFLNTPTVQQLEELPAHNCLTWVDGTVVIKIPR